MNIRPKIHCPSSGECVFKGVVGHRPIFEAWDTKYPEMQMLPNPINETMSAQQTSGLGLVCRILPFSEILCKDSFTFIGKGYMLSGNCDNIQVDGEWTFTPLNGKLLRIKTSTQLFIEIEIT